MFFVHNEDRAQSVRYSFSAERKYFCRGGKNVLHLKMQLFNRFTEETQERQNRRHTGDTGDTQEIHNRRYVTGDTQKSQENNL